MASVDERVRSNGTSGYAVLYRHGKKQKSKTFDTRKAADWFASVIDNFGVDEALRQLAEKDAKVTDGLTVDDIANAWLEVRQAHADAGDLTPRVMRGYRRDYQKWIAPTFGKRVAAAVDEGDVQAWIDWMRKQPKSGPKSIADRRNVLHMIYKWASDPRRKPRLVDHNPTIKTDVPPRERKPPKGMYLHELHSLIDTARDMYPDAADMIEFMAGTGWRLGEALALTAGQIEDDGVTVWVSMGRVWRREVGFIESAKTEGSQRRLRVLGGAVAVLRRRTAGLRPGDLVFATTRGRPWEESTFRNHYFYRIRDAAGLEQRGVTPHWLRHTHVLVCHAAGMSLTEISRRLGHSNIQTTINLYGRLIDDMDESVATKLDALLTSGALPIKPDGRPALDF